MQELKKDACVAKKSLIEGGEMDETTQFRFEVVKVILGAIGVFVASWIAFKQMRIAEGKIRWDLYYKRFEIYRRFKVLETLLEDVEPEQMMEHSELYFEAMAEKVFLLPKDIIDYITNTEDLFSAYVNCVQGIWWRSPEKTDYTKIYPRESHDSWVKLRDLTRKELDRAEEVFMPVLGFRKVL